jgi:hypothetical protein
MSRVIAIRQGGRAGPPTRRDEFVPLLRHLTERELLGRPVLSPPCRDYDHADDVRKGIYLSARYYCSCGKRSCTRKHGNTDGCPDGGQRLSCRADIVRTKDGKLCVEIIVRDKRHGIEWAEQKYGTDRNAWPYQPGRRRAD